MGTVINASQAWAILSRHAHDEISPLRLQELMRDNERVSSLVTVYNSGNHMLVVDLSRQKVTLETIRHLLSLAHARKLKKFIRQLAWGQNDPDLRPVLPTRLRHLRHSRSHSGSRHHQHHHYTTTTIKTTHFSNRPTNNSEDLTKSYPTDQIMPTMFMSLRVPAKQGYEMLLADGSNALDVVHHEWGRIQRISEDIRKAQIRGVTGSMIKDVLVIGRGVAIAALEFLYRALMHDATASYAAAVSEGPTTRIRRNIAGIQTNEGVSMRKMFFLSSIDPVHANAITQQLDPATTMVVSIALRGDEETGIATKTVKTWLLRIIGTNRTSEQVLSKHMMLVTGNDHIAGTINKPDNVFLLPDHSRSEAFTSLTAATLLPLSIVFGWKVVQDILDGAHDMDKHFVETNPRHNVPVLLALMDVWNDVLLDADARTIVPYMRSVQSYPNFLASLEAQACSRAGEHSPDHVHRMSCAIVNGRSTSFFDRASYQSHRVMNTEFIAVMDSQLKETVKEGVDDALIAQDALLCSLFAHADELALGTERYVASSSMSISELHGPAEGETCGGNRPSSLLLCDRLDAFACGQFVALTELRAITKAHIWGMDPFTIQHGSSIRSQRTQSLKDELLRLYENPPTEGEDVDTTRYNLSTKTILGHYASLMSTQQTRPR